MFTRDQIEEIKKKLIMLGTKDTQFPDAHKLNGEEIIAIVQDGENKKIPLSSIINDDFINVSKDTTEILTLSTAVSKIDINNRKLGQVITFKDSANSWAIRQFTGSSLDNWNDISLWKSISGIDELKSQVETNAEDISVLSNEIERHDASILNLNTDVSKLKDKDIETSSSLSELNTKVDTLKSQADTNTSNISSLNTEVSTLQSKVDENTTSISQINNNIADNNKSIAQINTALDEHTESINAKITTDRIEDGAVTSEKIATSAFDNTLSVIGKIAPADMVGRKLTDLEGKTADITKEIIKTEDESITIEDNNGNVIAELTPDSSTFKNLKNNGKDVLTAHQDISNLATKEDLDGIEHESIAEKEEEVVFEEEDGNFCARVNHRGVDSVGYALNGNPITKTHYPSNQCKGLTHYYHEGGDTIQYTYDFTDDSYIIHNPNGVNGNIYAEIVGLKAGKTYRISGIGSGITSTKRICASNVASGLNNTIAELEDNGEGIYSAEFTVLENTITTINITPRYNSKLTSFTNIKVIEVSDVERSVLVNDFIDNISLEELSDDLKKHLLIDENPTTYCGRSACVFNNVLFIGDSLTEGAFNKKGTNGMSDASGSFYRQEHSYPYFFKKLTGANGENWGLGGHTTKAWWDVRTTEGHPSYKPDDQWKGFDCAIIALGTNDAFRSSSASDTITALNNIINKVLTLNPRISVFVATPFGGRFALDSKFTEVSETIRGVVNGRTDCYLLDINRYGHMNDKRGYNAGHFTAIGYERLAEDIINYMSWIIDSNDWDFRHVQFSNTDYEPFN